MNLKVMLLGGVLVSLNITPVLSEDHKEISPEK